MEELYSIDGLVWDQYTVIKLLGTVHAAIRVISQATYRLRLSDSDLWQVEVSLNTNVIREAHCTM